MKIAMSRARFFQLLRYMQGCMIGGLVKLTVTFICNAAGLPIRVGYLLALIVVTFTAYFYHSKITFHQKISGWGAYLRSFGLFVCSVILFHLADYILMVLGTEAILAALEREGLVTLATKQMVSAGMIVILGSIIVTLRYFCYSFIFPKKNSFEHAETPENAEVEQCPARID